MAVYKQDGCWVIKGKIKKDDGSYFNYKRKIKSSTSKREALDYETDFIRQYQEIEKSKKHETFEALCMEFLENDTNIKKVSQRTKKDVLDKVCLVLGKKKINLITREHLNKYIKELEGKYSHNYVSKFYYAIKGVFNYAVDQGYLQTNPMTRVHLTIVKDEIKKEMLFWEPNHFNEFIKNVSDKEFKVFFMVLYYMGIRKGEAQALNWNDIDFGSNTINVSKTVTNKIKGSAWEITSPKTKNSNRKISMPKILTESLLDWKKEQSQVHGFNNACFVFGFYKPLSRTTIARKLEIYVNKTNEKEKRIPLIRVHDFRHSHASFLLNNMSDKFTDFDVAKRLGDTVETLHNTYAHWFKSADKGIIEVMDGVKNNNQYTELIELKELLDSNIISNEEFNKKKKQILGI